MNVSSCSTRIVRFSGAVGKTFSCDDADRDSILARKDFFLITSLIFIGPTRYQASFYFRATLGVKEVLQSSKFSTSIF